MTSLGYPEPGPWATATSIRNGQSQPGLYAPGSFPTTNPSCASPQSGPIPSPTSAIIASDLLAPSLPPASNKPTAKPTMGPTAGPTAGPTQDLCSNTFVECAGGMSQCFSSLGMTNEPSQWGWSIDVSSLGPGDSLTCAVYMGAQGCVTTSATQVGTVTITPTSVTWSLESQYGGMGFHLYAGKCPVSDAGMHLNDASGACDTANEAQWFYTPTQYSLTASFTDTYPTKFYFDSSNNDKYLLNSSNWANHNYQAFPIGSEGWQYLTIHASVCGCGAYGVGCSAITAAPTSSPTAIPTGTPTHLPTAKPNAPTVQPTKAPITAAPTHPPTKNPTSKPTASPTVARTSLPTVKPGSPTATPFVAQAIPISGCETAYVYCGDLSQCFLDQPAANKPNNRYSSAWGWYNDLSSLSAGASMTCDVIAGAGQCKMASSGGGGVKVGTMTITADSVTWNLMYGVGGQDFHFYAGKCPVNDGGAFLPNLNTSVACDFSSMQQFARTPGQYTCVSGEYGNYYNTFTFNSTNYAAFEKGNWATYNYAAFPIGASGHQYMSAHATVCPCNSDACYNILPEKTAAPTVHVQTYVPTVTPRVPDPTSSPSKKPTVAPGKPTQKPVVPPTAVPTAKPTAKPTMAPSAIGHVSVNATGETAYVMCPGLSSCFISTYSHAWGWNIDLSLYTGSGPLECPIYAGAGKCQIQPNGGGFQVGTAIISATSVEWKFYTGVGGSGFHFYAGKCPVNDAGDSLVSKSGQCVLKGSMDKWARTPGSYTLIAGDPFSKYVSDFTFASTNYAQYIKPGSNWAVANYDPFPLAVGSSTGSRYLSLHAGVYPCSQTGGCVFNKVFTRLHLNDKMAHRFVSRVSKSIRQGFPSKHVQPLSYLSSMLRQSYRHSQLFVQSIAA